MTLNLIDKKSEEAILKAGLNLMHLGLIVVGIKGMTRKQLGSKTSLMVYDGRHFKAPHASLGLTEIDMNYNGGIFYCSPDYLMKTNEFAKHIKIGIQIKGLEMNTDTSNLLGCIGYIGLLTETCQTNFQLNVKGIVELMGSKGMRL